MSNKHYLKKYLLLKNQVYFVYQKSTEFQVQSCVLDQIENLLGNCEALIKETETLSSNFNAWLLFEESYEDLKLDYFFILKLLEKIKFK